MRLHYQNIIRIGDSRLLSLILFCVLSETRQNIDYYYIYIFIFDLFKVTLIHFSSLIKNKTEKRGLRRETGDRL